MVSNRRRILPPHLYSALLSLGDSLERGMSPEELERVLHGLGRLPAKLAVQAAKEIADAAQLTQRAPAKYRWLEQLLRPVLSEAEQLHRTPDVAWLFLFHHNGYVREMALDTILSAPSSEFFFAAIAWRLNDWAEPVRRAASRCASRVFPLADPDVAAAAGLYLIDRHLVWGRWHDEHLLLDLIFARHTVMERLATRLREHAHGPLATALLNALRYPTIDEHLPRLAREARQPTVRAVALRCLLDGKGSWPVGFKWQWIDKVYGQKKRIRAFANRPIQAPPRDVLLTEGLSDRSAVVRRVAADGLIADRSGLLNVDEMIARLAADKSPSIRERADFLIRHPSR